MKAIILNEFGGTDKLIMSELPIPAITGSEVLIKVKAISINPVDVRTRAGGAMAEFLKAYKPLILGWDIAGEVVETGDQVRRFKKGDRVFGMVNFLGHGKGYAEYVAAPASQLALIPDKIGFDEAAAATLAALTAWQLLKHYAKVKTGNKILIQAASGGVGHYAVQIAKSLGAYVVGVSSAKNRDFVLSLGANEHIAYDEQDFEKRADEFDIVIDAFAFDNLFKSLKAVKPGGKIISLLPMISQEVKLKAKKKNADIHYALVKSNGTDMREISKLLGKGILKSRIDKIYPFEEMGNAHSELERWKTTGKIIVKI